MSSLYTRSKEFTRNRKSQSDSPPSSPSPIAKTLRVSSVFVTVFHCDLLSAGYSQRLMMSVCPLVVGDLSTWFTSLHSVTV